jgi:hypothetical protein
MAGGGFARRTGHEFGEVTVGFPEDHIPVLGNLLLELLLQVSASVLVLAQGQDITLQVFQPHSGESVVCEKC